MESSARFGNGRGPSALKSSCGKLCMIEFSLLIEKPDVWELPLIVIDALALWNPLFMLLEIAL